MKSSLILKFNSGLGAVICNKCKTIIIENFYKKEWDALVIMSKKESAWYCPKCNLKNYKRMCDKFRKLVNVSL